MNPEAVISEIKRHYVRQKLTFYGLLLLAFTVVLLAIYCRWRPENFYQFFLISLWLAGTCCLIWQVQKARRISPAIITQHLNRTYPELQESCHLLLTSPEKLYFLERLQVQRLAFLLAHLDFSKAIRVPFKMAWLAVGLSVLLAGIIFFLPYLPRESAVKTAASALPEKQTGAIQKVLPAIPTITIRVRPPAYTHQPAYTVNTPNFKAVAGSRLTWEIKTSAEVSSLQLTLTEKQNLIFRKVNNQSNTYIASLTPAKSFIYTLSLNHRKSSFYAVELLPDQNPVITIRQPKPYTELLFGDLPRVNLEASLLDDYGLQKASLVATVAKGSGESVTFQELRYPLPLTQTKNSNQQTVRQQLDLKALGLTYGDELYFYLQAWDNHRGYTRSATYFVQLEDTTLTTSGSDLSLPVAVVPAYFRSQRQLIIDTEKLMREKKELPTTTFQEQSNNLGADQKILRLRYGKFLGEESETVSGADPAAGHDADDGHDHKAQPDKASELLAPYVHRHDTEEDATYFEPTVKVQLKAALAHMWEAELRLRLSQPEAALPFEYKALRLLKDVQQKSRAYVRKLGFEAPPIKETEKRLTGELTPINAPLTGKNQPEKLVYPSIRQALAWLVSQKAGKSVSGQKALLLQQAGQELAQVAVNRPAKYLSSLQALRTLITEVQAGKITCKACLNSVTGAFANVLPDPPAAPHTAQVYRHALAESYFRNVK